MAEEEQDKMETESLRRIAGSVATPSGCAFIYYRDEAPRRGVVAETGKRDQGTEEVRV